MSGDSLRDRRARDQPPPDGCERRMDPLLGISFATHEALELARGVPLLPHHFDGHAPSSPCGGYTEDDVRTIAAGLA